MIHLPSSKTLIKWALILASFLIVSSILWNTNQFFRKFKSEERIKMEVLATAYENFNTPDLDIDVSLEQKIIQSNRSIPMIITYENGDINRWANLDVENNKGFTKLDVDDRLYLSRQLQIMMEENEPLVVNFQLDNVNITQKIYYRDSDLLNRLQYYPFALLLILFLFGTIIYLAFKSNKIAEQNKLWAGMAKETAHQIGTPLSSLLGWVELLRMEEVEEDTVKEIEKDVDRLNTIADRFSKIGSIPKLTQHDIVKETDTAFDYIRSRSFKQIEFTFNTENDKPIYVDLNLQLYSWVIENLVKNAIDAMQGKGKIDINVVQENSNAIITISDTGKGIPKRLQKKIFEPGYTTKKRGWGLGLSLTKRIISDYHKGRIYVKKSEIGVGTTFLIQLKVSEEEKS
ncbi:HAMP domain-containing sensor histidine kinase [Lutimonas halocynthiae]|uniref:sensor histidine kinase n=1 Tax=Lutimonas halocynthiae TaxID=1446477 RepID=UPI0025B53006|nr:HAMP domain-containing sensor histidine kinase [Lutimonas halocynthiae]MDN3641659.1 HAMP domain-containing sensor histidine kinase [Lutimonas halocynthiae]